MPYENELASKSSHSDFLRNPDIKGFLEQCAYLKPPSDEEAESLANRFVEPPTVDVKLPSFIMAIDGSNYESSIENKLPNTRVGFIKIGTMLISLEKFGSLRAGKFVDPFRVAALQDDNAALTFSVPSANIRWGGKANVRESFRAYMDMQFAHPRTCFADNDFNTSLRSTLFHMASLRRGELGTDDPSRLKLHQCPNCGTKKIEVRNVPEPQYCPICKGEVYATDCLRIWEDVSDFQSNQIAITRLMQMLEHLIPVHYMRYLMKTPLLLSNMAYFIDGPLAIFGSSSWLHRSILIFIHEINKKLKKFGQLPLTILGLQKTGQVVDHVNLIDRFLPANRLFAIDDEYRYQYILTGREPSSNTFGWETYYGQDFIFKTPSGRTFVFALPYPHATKELVGMDFVREKTRFENYPQLSLAVQLITHLESDLYENAVVPIALAHRYTAISLQPGGRVLDLLTKNTLIS